MLFEAQIIHEQMQHWLPRWLCTLMCAYLRKDAGIEFIHKYIKYRW